MVATSTEIIYKYRYFDGRSISMLTNNQLYFASPLEFNDPFDCAAQEHTFENFSPTTKLEELAVSVGIAPSMISPEKTKRLQKVIQTHPKILKIQEGQQKQDSEFLKNIGILSLTKRPDSILMWSHYADCHKGFCIGFRNNLGLPKEFLKPVNYTKDRNNDVVDQYIMMNKIPTEKQNDKFLEYNILTKYIDWAYEEEYRIVGSKGIAIYPADCLECIIFGLKMPIENIKTILHLLQNRDVSFFKAVKNHTGFKIEINPL